MCGICGIVGAVDRNVLEQMLSALEHRGPDDRGVYCDQEVGLGIRRLSIIDLESGRQPQTNETGEIVIVFNGEIYNFGDLRAELEQAGHRFTTKSDTEVIVHAYEQYGDNFITRLRGMFAIAIWDKPRKRLLLVRDRFGIKPLYYVERQGSLYFASEIRALLAAGVVEPAVNPEAVALYIGFPCVPAPWTIIQGVKALRPAHLLIYESNRMTDQEYWRLQFPESRGTTAIPEAEHVSKVRSLLEESIKLRLRSDVPLGAFLSGGIDSSSVVGLMQRFLNRPVKTYSIAFSGGNPEYSKFNELSYAQSVARHLGTDHTEIIVGGQELYTKMARMIWAMDQPSGDALQYYLVSELARSGVTVALSGTGGDEVFAGYEWFKEVRRLAALDRLWSHAPRLVKLLVKGLTNTVPKSLKTKGPLRKLDTFIRGSDQFEARYRLNRRLYRQDEWRLLFTDEFLRTLEPAWTGDEIAQYAPDAEALDPINAVSYLQLKTDLVNLLLRDQDAVSMAHSLEVRVPLIDHVLAEYVASVPPHLKLNGDTEKYILRQAVSDILPPEIVSRRKKGFMFPMHLWMTNELRPLVEATLNRASLQRRGIFRPPYVEAMAARFFAGREPFFKVWNLVAFELWCRSTVDLHCYASPLPDTRELLSWR